MKQPKTILVTGASSGFGEQMALALAARGHRVYGTSRQARPVLGDPSNPVRMLALDLCQEASVQACIQALVAEAGVPDVVVNNAGSGLTGAIEDCADDEARWQMETNLHGPLRVIRAVLPLMRERGSGRLITIGSLAGLASLPYQGLYSASKHALEAVNEALRLELQGSGIDATIVCPGDYRTGFTAARVFARQARSPAHARQLETTLGIYERDERNGADPRQVARLLVRLVEARRLKVRYLIGRTDQVWGMALKRLLPATVFEWVLRRIYSLP